MDPLAALGQVLGGGQEVLAAALREVLHRRRHERLAGLEVMQVGATGDACALGHPAGGGLGVSVLDEAGDRRVEQRLPGRGAAGGLAAAFGGGGGAWPSRVTVILLAFMHERFCGSVRGQTVTRRRRDDDSGRSH